MMRALLNKEAHMDMEESNPLPQNLAMVPGRNPGTPPPVGPPPSSADQAVTLGQPAVDQAVDVPQEALQISARETGHPTQQANAKNQARKKLQEAIGDSQEVLCRAQTVFPFTLFPDTITIDRSKIDITHRNFFRVEQTTSMRIEDILTAVANVGPFFGSLKITTRFFGAKDDTEYALNYLTRHDALQLKRILQGYIIARQRKIDCSSLAPKELAKLLNELGANS
jgi:hypothetical protein